MIILIFKKLIFGGKCDKFLEYLFKFNILYLEYFKECGLLIFYVLMEK